MFLQAEVTAFANWMVTYETIYEALQSADGSDVTLNPSCYAILSYSDQLRELTGGQSNGATADLPDQPLTRPDLPDLFDSAPEVLDYNSQGYVPPVTSQVSLLFATHLRSMEPLPSFSNSSSSPASFQVFPACLALK